MNLQAFRAFGASFALVLLGAVAYANIAPIWNGATPSTTGPWLGDANINLGNVYQATAQSLGMNFWPGLSVSQTAGQANCTQLQRGMNEIKTSAAAGYVCLPPAVPGSEVFLANATGQTVNVYSSNTPAVSGTPDTINTVAGSTAYAGLTTLKNADCFAPALGAWYCAAAN